MTKPIDTLKASIIDQLKSCGDAVQDAFEQRIARPFLSLKRDLRRPTSVSRTPFEQTPDTVQQESNTSSTPIGIDDIEINTSLKTIFDKVKLTLSPSTTTKRSVLDNHSNDTDRKRTDTNESCRHSSISCLSDKTSKSQLRHHKSVSFADKYTVHNNDQDLPANDPGESLNSNHGSSQHVSLAAIDEAGIKQANSTMTTVPIVDKNEYDFERHFHYTIRPRRVSIGKSQDIVYQDLSAEIVAYVLKHALRILEKEDEELLQASNQKLVEESTNNEDFIDLK